MDTRREFSDIRRTPFTALMGNLTPAPSEEIAVRAGRIPKDRGATDFLGLRMNPFSSNAGGSALPLTRQVQEALAELLHGIQTRKGFIVLTGEVGTGKTTLINQLRLWLDEQQIPTAFVFNPLLDAGNLFHYILSEFGVPPDPKPQANALTRLQNRLFAQHRAGKTAVLIVDEAQGLSPSVLTSIGLLLNLEASQEKLVQIVLSGQPELDQKLRQPELRALRQRIALRCRTSALNLEDTCAYVESRLRAAGASTPVFSPDALTAVYFYSRGIPRVINLLCEHALIGAATRHVRPVPSQIVEEVAREFQFDEFRPLGPAGNSRYSTNANLLAMNAPVSPAAWHSSAAVEPGRRPLESLAVSESFSSPGVAPQPRVVATLSAQNSSATSTAQVDPKAQAMAPHSAPAAGMPGAPASIPSPANFEVARTHDDKVEKRLEPRVAPIHVAPEATSQSRNELAPPQPSFVVSASNLFGAISESCRRNSSSLMRWLRQPIQPVRVPRIASTKRP